MNPLDFFQRVLPTEGIYCRFTLSGKRNRFFSDLAEMADNVVSIDQSGQDAYFAISTFVDDSSRRNVNVQATKVITIDVDCGSDKPFPTWKEGLKALGKFISDAKLPKPLIIRSGNGLHTYWIMERDLDRDEWTPLARAMKDAAEALKFDVDPTKTADPSLVLRPVGTHNYKDPANPKRVEVLIDGGDTTVDALKKALAYYYTASNTPVKPKNNGLRDSLAVRSDMPPAVGSMVVEKCAQVKWASENQDRVTEPLWYALIGVAAFCEDPEGTAKRWSEHHPGYSETATLKKMEQWRAQATGPTTCAKFEAERPVGCKGCPLAGKIGSPAALGVRYKEVDTSANAPAAAVTGVIIPKPFKRTDVGIMATIDGADISVAPFDLYPLGYGYDEHLGYEVAQFMWERPHVGWKVLTMRQAYLADGTYREFVGVIADQGIVLETKRQTEYFQIMLRSYMNELRKVQTVTNHYATMGWKEDNKVFVLGDDLYRRNPDGTVVKDTIQLAAHANRAGSDMFTTKGSFETWRAGTDLLRRAKMYPHQFSIGLGFASILMQFTGLKGMTVSLYGPSGSGKSQAQLMQQSVWGDPEKLHFQSKFTANSLFNRFGLYGSLPMTVDEATQMSDKDVGDYLYWVSQGRDKARLTRSAEEKTPREWALISTLSTNKPITNKLISAGDENDAQLARLLELRVDKSPIYSDGTDAGRKLHRLFTENYGHAGRKFVKRLMEYDEQEIRAIVASAFDEFPDRYGKRFSGVERYWEVGTVMPELGLRLAHDWDIVAFSGEPSAKWAVGQLDAMRETMAENRLDAFDLLAQYVNEHLSDMLMVWHDPGKDPLPNYDRLPRGPIRIRIDGLRNTGSTKLVGGTMLIDRGHFRKWFVKHGGNPREFIGEIVRDGADATPATKKASLGKHTPMSPPQCYVIGVNLKHPRLRSILEGIEQKQENVLMQDVIDITARR
jgi:hypothetical protein